MTCARCGGEDHNVRTCSWPVEGKRDPLQWEDGWHPVGWRRGEFLTVEQPVGQFRGYVEIAMDTHGSPVVPRAKTVKQQIEFSANDAHRVAQWIEWWRAPEYADRVEMI